MAIKPAGTASDRGQLRGSIQEKRKKGNFAEARKLQVKERQARRDIRLQRLFQEGYEKSGLPKMLKKRQEGRELAAKTARDKQEAALAAQTKERLTNEYRKFLTGTQTNLKKVPNKLGEIGAGFTLDDSLTDGLKNLETLPGFETLDLNGLQERQRVLAGLLDQLKDRVRNFLTERYKNEENSQYMISTQLKSYFQWTLDLPLDLNGTVRSKYPDLVPES